MQQHVETHEDSVKFNVFVHVLAAILTLTDEAKKRLNVQVGTSTGGTVMY